MVTTSGCRPLRIPPMSICARSLSQRRRWLSCSNLRPSEDLAAIGVQLTVGVWEQSSSYTAKVVDRLSIKVQLHSPSPSGDTFRQHVNRRGFWLTSSPAVVYTHNLMLRPKIAGNWPKYDPTETCSLWTRFLHCRVELPTMSLRRRTHSPAAMEHHGNARYMVWSGSGQLIATSAHRMMFFIVHHAETSSLVTEGSKGKRAGSYFVVDWRPRTESTVRTSA